MSKTILVGNHIKPKRSPTRTEHIYGKAYVFADKNKDGHFITEVTDPNAAELMLSQPHHFYAYPPDKPRLSRGGEQDDAAAQAAKLKEIEEKARKDAEEAERQKAEQAEAARIAEEAAKQQGGDQGGEPAPPADPALVSEAQALLELNADKIPTEMQKLKGGMAALKVALNLEKAGKDRKTVVKALEDAIALASGEPPAN